MGLAAVFESKKLLAIIAVAIIAVGLFADFITTVVWFSRINPYFSHGESKAKQTHGGAAACFVFSLIALLAIVVLAVLALFVKPLFEKISENNLLSLVCIAVIGALCVGNVIAGIVAAAPAVKNEKVPSDCYEGPIHYECKKDGRCYNSYIDDVPAIYKYYCSYYFDSQHLLKKTQLALNKTSPIYQNLRSKAAISSSLLKERNTKSPRYHIPTEEEKKKCDDFEKYAQENFIDDDGAMRSTICRAVGIPTIIFSVVEIVGIILFLIVAFPNLNSEGGNKSANENA